MRGPRGSKAETTISFYALFSQVVDNSQLVTRVSSVQYRRLYHGMSARGQGSLGAVLKAGYPWSLVSASLLKMGVVLADIGSVVVALANSCSDNSSFTRGEDACHLPRYMLPTYFQSGQCDGLRFRSRFNPLLWPKNKSGQLTSFEVLLLGQRCK